MTVLIGVDPGKVTTSLAWASTEPDGSLGAVRAVSERHYGEPLESFLRLYREIGGGNVAGIVAAGAYGGRLGEPVLSGLPEEIAQEYAIGALYPDAGPINVVRIGGSGYSVLTRDEGGRFAFEKNERCSAGTGETMERLCARLGCTLTEAVALAQTSADGVAVTARCSVFAKSELTHFANQGEPHGRLFRGYFESVAKNVHALYDKVKVDGPVVLIGHGASIVPLVEAFALLAARPVEVAPQAGVFEALGALHYAAQHRDTPAAIWPLDPESLVRHVEKRVRGLRPAHEMGGSVTYLTEPAKARGSEAGDLPPESVPAVLGLDLGSTGSKAALLEAAGSAVIVDVYRRTDGNPVEAAKALVAQILEATANPVVAVGITGSGRDAAATVFRAAYPDLGPRICVQNEIVAHATAAAHFDPDGGRSLSIVEIGGQDAKFMNVKGGHILESDMNRVCSAGTGSFLEEQAIANGIEDISEFGEMAARAQNPPELGQMCTVFVANVAADALADGYTREDIFAGLEYSVIRNYKNRVMGNRQFLDRVFFQGKPATNPSLARTLAAVTDREVTVPPNPGAMGAIGIAMLAAKAVDGTGATESPAIDLSRILDAQVTGRREFHCKDRDCQNMCRIESATVQVGAVRQQVVSGGNCPKYDTVSAAGRKLPKDAPSPYRERAELIEQLLAKEPAAELPGISLPAWVPSLRPPSGGAPSVPLPAPRVAIPYAHYLIDYLPFFHAFFVGLGTTVEVIYSDGDTMATGDRRCGAGGSCAPVKIAHGLAITDADYFFMPTFVNVLYPNAGPGTSTCPMAQGAPEMVEAALRTEGATIEVLRPVLLHREGDDLRSARFMRELAKMAAAVAGLSLDTAPLLATGSVGGLTVRTRDGSPAAQVAARFWAAYREARARQRTYERGLRDIGRRALHFGRERGYPVVLIAGETHVIHEPVMSSGIQELVAANGAIALPVDCFPVPDSIPRLSRVHWASAGSTLRASLAGMRAGGVYPLVIGAYGCGLNSFTEHLFNDMLEDYPHTILESDGHGGKAGYVTRVQAFLHSVLAYETLRGTYGDAVGPATQPSHLHRYDILPSSSLRNIGNRKVFFGNIGGTLGRQVAAAMRGYGVEAEFVGSADPEAMRKAQQGCSGKECLPYQLIWGTFTRFLEEKLPELNGAPALFLTVGTGFAACRANLFPLTEQLALDGMGLGGQIQVGDLSLITENVAMTPVVWAAGVAVDLLNMMRFYHLSTERTRGDADALFSRFADSLEKLLERPVGEKTMMESIAEARPTLDRIEHLMTRASEAFRDLLQAPRVNGDLRDVFLCGDAFLRVDEWGNDDLQRKLSDLGLRVLFEPFGEFFEMLALRDTQDLPLTDQKSLKRRATLKVMAYVTGRLLGAVRPAQPYVFWHDIRAIDLESRRLFDGYPFGESIPTIGSALLTWRTQPVDGVVVVSPRGCGPALISEAQLRRQADIPILFVYNDGDPIDDARLTGFAWRLRGQPARRGAA